ncbi:MAG: CNP1-like family protein [Gammaproteobacteria bacterium]
MSKQLPGIALALFVTAVTSPLFAAPDKFEYDFDEPKPWQETEKALPAYPRDEDLLPINVQTANADFKFFIDSKTIAVTEDDVVTYTTVITSSSGAKNVLREGLRCGFAQYKLYAYGTADQNFYANKVPEWQSIPKNGTNSYRKELAHYMCGENLLPLKPKQIVDRIRYPEHIPTVSN